MATTIKSAAKGGNPVALPLAATASASEPPRVETIGETTMFAITTVHAVVADIFGSRVVSTLSLIHI